MQPCNVFNFYYLPKKFSLYFINSCSFVSNICLKYIPQFRNHIFFLNLYIKCSFLNCNFQEEWYSGVLLMFMTQVLCFNNTCRVYDILASEIKTFNSYSNLNEILCLECLLFVVFISYLLAEEALNPFD